MGKDPDASSNEEETQAKPNPPTSNAEIITENPTTSDLKSTYVETTSREKSRLSLVKV